MPLNLEITSSTERAVVYEGDYGNGDLVESSITIDFAVSGAASYSVIILDDDSGNPQTSVTNLNLTSVTISLSLLKNHFSAGTHEFNGTLIVQVTEGQGDQDAPESAEFPIDFKFVVTNNGTYNPPASFTIDTNGIAISTELDRNGGVDFVERMAYPIVTTMGGTGPFEVTWVPESFDHFLIEEVADLDQSTAQVKYKLDVANELPEELFKPDGGKWTQTGVFNVVVVDTATGDTANGTVSWTFTVTVAKKVKDSIINESRIIPGRFRVRSILNNNWYDLCYHEMYVFDKEYKQWVRLFPNKVLVRDGGNNDWIEIGCMQDVTYDDPCAGIGGDSSCIGDPRDPEAGSGNGLGSEGALYDEDLGYPPGFDMPDSFMGGFGMKIAQKATGYETPVGFMLQRPGLQTEETYDPSGLSPDEAARGVFTAPNLNGASTFSRGAAVTETVYELPPRNGYYELLYAAYDAVSIDVYYAGVRVATTCGPVPALTRGLLTFNINIAAGFGEKRVMVRVRGAEGVRWAYQVIGPKPAPVLQDFDTKDDADYAKIQEFLYEEPEMMQLQYIGTPMFPAPCHGTVGNIDQTFPWALSDRIENQNWFEYYHYVGENGGPMVLDFSSWDAADYVEIWQNGVRIATSQDYHQQPGYVDFIYEPRDGVQDIMVRVHTENRGLGQDLSSWYYTLFCPNAIGHRRSPWPCGPDVVYSMGHPATEDNFDIDNGVTRGAFKVFMRGCSETTLVRVFSRSGDLIVATEGVGDFDVEGFNFNEVSGEVYKDIYVRVESSIGASWEYTVGCPIPLLDITLDPIDPAVEWSIDDVMVDDTEEYAELTISINKSQLIDRSIEFSTEDSTAYDQTDYCAISGVATIPAGQTTVKVQVELAPCDGSVATPAGDWTTARITKVSDIVTDNSNDAYAAIRLGMITRSDDPTAPPFPGYQNLGPTNDTVTITGANPEITGSAGSHLAVTRVEPQGLKQWRATVISGTPDSTTTSSKLGAWQNSGTLTVGVSAFNTTTPDGLQSVGVKIDFEYDDGTLLSQNVILEAKTPVATTGGGTGGGGCLEVSTPVSTPDGIKLAGEVEVGDVLLGKSIAGMIPAEDENWKDWSSDNVDGEIVEVTVKHVKVDEYHTYFLINDDLKITTAHDILVKRYDEWQWLYADFIEVGHKLLGQDGTEVEVTSIEKVRETISTVHIDVEEVDNYFCGTTPILVHNIEENEKH